MPKALWNNQIIAEAPSSEIHRMEGNLYFSTSALKRAFHRHSETPTHCHWKGKTSNYILVVDGKLNVDASWYYPEPSAITAHIKGYIHCLLERRASGGIAW